MRLTSLRTRKGNSGFTELIKGNRVPKSDQLCFINNGIQRAATRANLLNKEYNFLHKEDAELIGKLVNPELGKLIASLWAKLELNEMAPQLSLLESFEARLSEINKGFKSEHEFVVFHSVPALKFYMVTLDIRDVEHFAWCIIHRFYGYAEENFSDEVQITGSFYNLLGDYFFNVCRLIEKDHYGKVEYWQNPLTNNPLIISDASSSSEEL
jgi:cob(I)alamin adenosyltransferase